MSLNIQPNTRSSTIQAEEILKRLRQVQDGRKNDLKGIPQAGANANKTDPDFPTDHQTPSDPGFQLPGTITGSGSGPRMR